MTPLGVGRFTGIEAIEAFLDPSHVALASRLAAFRTNHLTVPDPDSDDQARRRARELLQVLGAESVLESIRGQDLRALCLMREATAFASPLADGVLAVQALVAIPILLAGTSDQRSCWIDGLINGRVMAAFAMSEPGAGSDVAAMQTTARRDDDGWVLDGEKHLISNAGVADVYMVFAVTTPGKGSRGISAFLVPSDAPGFTFVGPQLMSAPHPLGRIRFARCRLPASALLGDADSGFALGMITLDRVRPSVGAAACGMAARALTASVEHASTRRQFGETLAHFQIIREKIGRMATDLEAARLLVYRAAWQGDRHQGRITLDAAMAKSFATEAAQVIVDEAVQIAGGQGVLLGNPIERLYRAVRALRIYEGSTEIQRLIVAGELLGRSS